MKKITFIIIMLIFSSALTVSAVGKVTYADDAAEFIFEPGSMYSPTDLFTNFKQVMPGDTLTQQITVRNNASDKVKVKIYIRSLGAQEGSAEFLAQMRLRVQTSDDNEMAYMFDVAADQSAQLTQWYCLGTLYSGGEVNLEVLLDVPTSLDDRYSNQIGYLDWEFMVEEFPAEGHDPKPPQTGDDFSMGFWLMVLSITVSLLILLVFWRKKHKDKQSGRAHV